MVPADPYGYNMLKIQILFHLFSGLKDAELLLISFDAFSFDTQSPPLYDPFP
jgi:hypothetical protein